ncbi:cyclo(L-tyrosyl-L-tyrosyl) synthase [Saccharopolyspora kobensis]|uniref:Cyclodipeptide synthase n=1 Tax=Saccharopolyspora kobensis TaxID=146035 RepID=A0A1H5WQL0_9PSEU|nr:tRNA-dependent cyclodipeptide synthase [Saccharopolyspora kobensis]SEG01496.1 cyclo(L-tyrosyl-L-tyrosyl) synthase [Saccharopolyspora kobensis]SFD78240.1 cyclo(L-tyrosyl-L-tyrosyl) synthase [Saccharopolyspora kobensis]
MRLTPTTAVQLEGDAATCVEDDFTVEPYTENCRRVCARGEHLLVGVSPGNSYFSVDLLARLFAWAHRRFTAVDVVIPDTALVHTQLALGHEAKRAHQRSREECNRVHNRVVRAWSQAGLAAAPQRWHRLSDFTDHPRYQALLRQAEDAVTHASPLREACLQTSRTVLASRKPGASFTDEQIEKGAQYVVAELPFIVDTPSILGVPSSVSFYHRPAAFIREVVSARCGLSPAPNQGCALIRPRAVAGNVPQPRRATTS